MMSNRIIYKRCPLCDSSDISDLLTADCSGHPAYAEIVGSKITWKKCSACFHVFTNGYFSIEVLEVIFDKIHDLQFAGADIEKQRKVSAEMIDKVLPYASNGLWLDVGFGNGALLFTAQEYGFTPIGIDLRMQNVEEMKTYGIESHCSEITNLIINEECSVISMADVLEHTAFPRETLDSASRLLKTNGVIFLSMPNSESIVWKTLTEQNQNPYWAELEHYHNFSRTRLYALLDECGFTPVRYGISRRYRTGMEVIATKN